MSDEKESESFKNGIKPKSRIPSFLMPNISEVGDTHITRSQSVGHNMRATPHHNKSDDVRYMFSQPLLTDAGRGMKMFSGSRQRSSGTLSRPDIFYQVLNNI